MVAAELNPLAKVGGLADVIGALPKALAQNNQDVRIVIPKYGMIDETKYPLKKIAAGIEIFFENKNETVDIYQTTLPKSKVLIYLIDHPKYLGQSGVYTSADASSDGSVSEAHRFTFFTQAVLQTFEKINWQPDVFHCHDWHTAMLPPLLKLYQKPTPVLFTIHNLAYQGNYDADLVLSMLNSGIADLTNLPTIKNRLNHSGTINYLEQAILNADLLNTVSPTYAQEILTPEFGCGLENVLNQRRAFLHGILNGIDTEKFDPATDEHLPDHYSFKNLTGKKKNKAKLQKEAGLTAKSNTPLIGLVGRLTERKGLDILLPIMEQILQLPLQLVLLGTGDKNYEIILEKLSAKHRNFCAKIGFDESLAQRIYAGSDLFLMPSRFEPCGLGQMMAMRYGALPIVRATGGLKDTVIDFTKKGGTGFVFKNYGSAELLATIQKAIASFNNNKTSWQQAIIRGMQQDFSWTVSAKKYLTLYDELLSGKKRFNL